MLCPPHTLVALLIASVWDRELPANRKLFLPRAIARNPCSAENDYVQRSAESSGGKMDRRTQTAEVFNLILYRQRSVELALRNSHRPRRL